MAFVVKSERPCLTPTIDNRPGPGYYDANEKPLQEENMIPFLTSQKRTLYSKISSENPGPGTYTAPVSIQGYNTQGKTFYSAINPTMESIEETRQSNVFKSTTERFPKPKDADQPGPGEYNQQSNQQKVFQTSTGFGISGSAFKKGKESLTGSIRIPVPSIPSVVHAYGYTELPNKEGVVLNNNPLLEIQKFVGPGYYDVPATNNYSKPKGIAWKKTGTQRTDFTAFNSTNEVVGPGSYKLKARAFFSLYKLKPSAGFASKTLRSNSDLIQTKKKKKTSKQPNLMEEALNHGQNDEEIETPGPGYYYNSKMRTSFSKEFKPANLQFFGSGIERFENSYSSSAHVGPGKYNVDKTIGKKYEQTSDGKMPFITAEKRFDEKPEEFPGPGKYDIKNAIDPKSKTNGMQVERFGQTEYRFRVPIDGTPGPGSYYEDSKKEGKAKKNTILPKESYVFSSKSKREEARNKKGTNEPAPGSYDVSHHDLSTKFKKPEKEEENLGLVPKKPPFNTAVERFARAAAQIEEEDDDEDQFEDGWNSDAPTRGDLILQARKQPKASFAFSSKTQRTGIPLKNTKAIIPGPGKYYNVSQDEWNKKTFNVNFTND